MNIYQRNKLEQLIGRPFTEEEVSDVTPMVDTRQDTLLNQYLISLVPKKRVPVMVSARGLSAKLVGGPLAAEMILLALEAAKDQLLQSQDQSQLLFGSLLRRQLKFLDSDGLDFGAPASLSMLDQFNAMGVLTSQQVTALKEISLVPGDLSYQSMLEALNFVPEPTIPEAPPSGPEPFED